MPKLFIAVKDSRQKIEKPENLWKKQRRRRLNIWNGEKRLSELETKPSIFNPLFYMTSFLTGVIVGMKTDKISLGFTAETERQVMVHLNKHISSMPNEDKKSKAILEQMRLDEENHKDSAIEKERKHFLVA